MTIQSPKPVFISTCSGIGGFDKGAKLAGFRCIYQSDIDRAVEAVFNQNYESRSKYGFSDHRTTTGLFEVAAIEDLSFSSISNSVNIATGAGLSKGDVDLYISGSPCPDGSAANPNHKNFTYRNRLMLDQYRLAYEGEIKVGVFENVLGFLNKDMGHFRAELATSLSRIMKEYYIKSAILNAKDYSSRQDRDRFITMIVRKDLGVQPSFPEPEPFDSANYMHNLFPSVSHYFSKGGGMITTYRKHFRTMTASGSVHFFESGIKRPITLNERLVLSHLEGYDLDAKLSDGTPVSVQQCIRMLGNMVQIPFAHKLLQYVREKILGLM
ncbi:DNA cytosine methyltransferase [Flavisolibacter ginsengisoli]|jgi:site-specific DNA-cytosine methylase|uniref:Site-specific DNA-cytosine methylase n=1 Tax=Flavisolibacter ginsengisoli DSM 18119 TaxID=1121884 RepID=A0A1M5CGE9_9BACT|nr:DNA cytosine methyltransferase [Flavisolibacter ginsengisoli]SHF53770.1 Site-specific DNA-cytosine methylase [Flavisolibacter ginsengisoli DSM 18119]